jgi:hypothetical protein
MRFGRGRTCIRAEIRRRRLASYDMPENLMVISDFLPILQNVFLTIK